MEAMFQGVISSEIGNLHDWTELSFALLLRNANDGLLFPFKNTKTGDKVGDVSGGDCKKTRSATAWSNSLFTVDFSSFFISLYRNHMCDNFPRPNFRVAHRIKCSLPSGYNRINFHLVFFVFYSLPIEVNIVLRAQCLRIGRGQ